MNGQSWLVLFALVAAWWLMRSGKKLRPVRAHVHATGDLRKAARHEGGHGAVGKHVGGRIGKAEIFADGSGYIEVHPRGKGFTPAQEIAISLGGAFGEGASIGSRQCSSDKANINAVLRNVPAGQRAATMAQARRLAKSGLFWQSGTASRIARDLGRRV